MSTEQPRHDVRAYAPAERLGEKAGLCGRFDRDCQGMPRHWGPDLPPVRPAWCGTAERTMLWCLEFTSFAISLALFYATGAPRLAATSAFALTMLTVGALHTYWTNRPYGRFALAVAFIQVVALGIMIMVRFKQF